ncbi:hypothetical protein M433DRAFT_147776 [Acidomyces richmondensis BFW]|nr:MAG: hypothetical protein FE78DRAFT_301014 [Acidomyces sp. 'richmondensis']KYG41297.1 hypothetical protein M433DRAFT_147776 [Acidomyces richmondensis BFW]
MYLDIAKHLKPELEQIGGFFGNIRYKSLTRPRWLLSLSDWVDEKALIRWRTHLKHHEAQEKGREEVFEDYHLRVGEVFSDTGFTVYKNIGTSIQTRFDITEVGIAKTLTLMEANFDESTAAIGEPGSERAGKSLASKIFHFNPGNSHPDLVS